MLAAGLMSSGWLARAQQNGGAERSWTFLVSADARNWLACATLASITPQAGQAAGSDWSAGKGW